MSNQSGAAHLSLILNVIRMSCFFFVSVSGHARFTDIECFAVIRSDADLRNGITEDKRDRTLRTLIRNFYQYHLNEIFYVLR